MLRPSGHVTTRLATAALLLSLFGLAACGTDTPPPPEKTLAEQAAQEPCTPRLTKKVRQLVFEFEQQRDVDQSERHRLARKPAGKPITVPGPAGKPTPACQFQLTKYNGNMPSWQVTTFSYAPHEPQPPQLHHAARSLVSDDDPLVQMLPTPKGVGDWRSWTGEDAYLIGPVSSARPAALAVAVTRPQGVDGFEELGKHLGWHLNQEAPSRQPQ